MMETITEKRRLCRARHKLRFRKIVSTQPRPTTSVNAITKRATPHDDLATLKLDADVDDVLPKAVEALRSSG